MLIKVMLVVVWQEQYFSDKAPLKQALLHNTGWENDFPKHTCSPQNLDTFLKIKEQVRGVLESNLIIRLRRGTRHELPHASCI